VTTNLLLHILGGLIACSIVLAEARSASRAAYFRIKKGGKP